jgi:hypothetical protein
MSPHQLPESGDCIGRHRARELQRWFGDRLPASCEASRFDTGCVREQCGHRRLSVAVGEIPQIDFDDVVDQPLVGNRDVESGAANGRATRCQRIEFGAQRTDACDQRVEPRNVACGHATLCPKVRLSAL